ncbi:MAG: type IV pilus modification PilV family protein [Steroidobacteraceae bacterium]
MMRLGTQRGATLVEVLITMVILITGLLGLVALQARLQIAQIEAYQRAQAAVLVSDISERVLANRIRAGQYVTNGPIGTGSNCANLTALEARAQSDIREWCEMLQGASTTLNGAQVGTLTGGRGCIEPIIAGSIYRVSVVWQGLAPLGGPAPGDTASTCGTGLYDDAGGGGCTADLCRRQLVSTVRIAELL